MNKKRILFANRLTTDFPTDQIHKPNKNKSGLHSDRLIEQTNQTYKANISAYTPGSNWKTSEQWCAVSAVLQAKKACLEKTNESKETSQHHFSKRSISRLFRLWERRTQCVNLLILRSKYRPSNGCLRRLWLWEWKMLLLLAKLSDVYNQYMTIPDGILCQSY